MSTIIPPTPSPDLEAIARECAEKVYKFLRPESEWHHWPDDSDCVAIINKVKRYFTQATDGMVSREEYDKLKKEATGYYNDFGKCVDWAVKNGFGEVYTGNPVDLVLHELIERTEELKVTCQRNEEIQAQLAEAQREIVLAKATRGTLSEEDQLKYPEATRFYIGASNARLKYLEEQLSEAQKDKELVEFIENFGVLIGFSLMAYVEDNDCSRKNLMQIMENHAAIQSESEKGTK